MDVARLLVAIEGDCLGITAA
jgi:hypothetical protein